MIGSGIFILTGTAAAGETLAVPSIYECSGARYHAARGHSGVHDWASGRRSGDLSFLPSGRARLRFAALCYAELASMIPIAGSTYTYAYATLGEIFAWIIGWDLILEYAVSNMAVAVGFSAYFNDILDACSAFTCRKFCPSRCFSGDS